MRRALPLAIGAAFLGGGIEAAQPPRFPKNMRYELARESLLAAGWQPAAPPSGARCERQDMCNERQPEVAACDATGLDRCTALWRSGHTIIHITIWGRSPPMVERVECEANCR